MRQREKGAGPGRQPKGEGRGGRACSTARLGPVERETAARGWAGKEVGRGGKNESQAGGEGSWLGLFFFFFFSVFFFQKIFQIELCAKINSHQKQQA